MPCHCWSDANISLDYPHLYQKFDTLSSHGCVWSWTLFVMRLEIYLEA